MPQAYAQSSVNPAPFTVASSTNATVSSAAIGSSTIGWLFLAVSFGLVLGLFGYKKHCDRQRSRLLKRQRAMLETIWRISSKK